MQDAVTLVVQQFEIVLKGWIETDRDRLGTEFYRQAEEMRVVLEVLGDAMANEIATTDIWVASPAQIARRRDLMSARRDIESVTRLLHRVVQSIQKIQDRESTRFSGKN